MDPNATLAKLLDAICDWEDTDAGSIAEMDAVDEIIAAARALDTWLARGGVLPDRWAAAGRFAEINAD